MVVTYSKPADYEFDGFRTGGMRARSVEAPSADADISDYVPKLDYLLVDVATPVETKTAGGVLLPETSVKDPVEGRVVAAGPGNHQNGVFIPNRVSVGEWVRFGAWAAEPARRIKVAGKVYALMREEDILMSRPSKSSEALKAMAALQEAESKRQGVFFDDASGKTKRRVLPEDVKVRWNVAKRCAELSE